MYSTGLILSFLGSVIGVSAMTAQEWCNQNNKNYRQETVTIGETHGSTAICVAWSPAVMESEAWDPSNVDPWYFVNEGCLVSGIKTGHKCGCDSGACLSSNNHLFGKAGDYNPIGEDVANGLNSILPSISKDKSKMGDSYNGYAVTVASDSAKDKASTSWLLFKP